MKKVLKFVKVTSSANDADEAYYVPVEEVKYFETSAAAVVFTGNFRNADGVIDDTITITVTAGKEFQVADKIAGLMSGNMSNGAPLVVDANLDSNITAIAYAVV